jgi:hypothetical protein
MPTPEFLDQQSVRRYAATLSDLTPRERDQRLDLLEAFAARVATTGHDDRRDLR